MPTTSKLAEQERVLQQDAPAGPGRGSLLIAMDGTARSLSAFRAGAAVARQWDLAPSILTVIEPSIVAAASPSPTSLVRAGVAVDRASRLRTICEQLSECETDPRDWPIEAVIGSPAQVIARAAMRPGVEGIAMGLRPHGAWDRITGRETVLHVVRRANIPVLAASPALAIPPGRLLVAMDFSRSSIRAARLALRLAAPDATVILAYVRPAVDFRADVREGAGIIMQQGVASSFKRLRRLLDTPRGAGIHPLVLDGRPADALLQAAADYSVDLVAAGRHRRDLVEKLTIGSVATQLIRAARCSVLITPPAPTAR